MKDDGSVIARRLAFLERELDRMIGEADDAELELRLNPTDAAARRRLEAIYVLTGETWNTICALRQGDGRRPTGILYDRHADASAQRAYRQALG